MSKRPVVHLLQRLIPVVALSTLLASAVVPGLIAPPVSETDGPAAEWIRQFGSELDDDVHGVSADETLTTAGLLGEEPIWTSALTVLAALVALGVAVFMGTADRVQDRDRLLRRLDEAAGRQNLLDWHGARTMTLELRRAVPSDAEEAIPLIYSSGPHEMDYAFAVGRHRAVDFLRTAFIDGSSTLGYRGHVVAVLDGHVVGIVASHDRADYNSTKRKIVYPVARFYGPLTGAAVLTRLTDLERQLWPPPKEHDIFIQNLGVREDMRGTAVGTALLTNQIEMARSESFRCCILDVAVTNPRAQTLCERLGYRVVEERRWHVTSSAVHVPDMRRMQMSL